MVFSEKCTWFLAIGWCIIFLKYNHYYKKLPIIYEPAAEVGERYRRSIVNCPTLHSDLWASLPSPATLLSSAGARCDVWWRAFSASP